MRLLAKGCGWMSNFLRALPLAYVIVFECHGCALEAETVDFVRDVQPLLKVRCQRCHSATTRKGGLDLSTSAGLLRGSESGRVLVPGKPSESRLWEVLHEGEMPPPGNQALTESQVELLERWIAQGATLGDTPPNRETSLNQHDVFPILLLRCVTCHGRQKQEGGLDLRSRAAMLKGGGIRPRSGCRGCGGKLVDPENSRPADATTRETGFLQYQAGGGQRTGTADSVD